MTLIFEYRYQGHWLEFLNHYYMGAVARPNERFVVLVHSTFKEKNKFLEWPVTNNIEFDYITDGELASFMQQSSVLKRTLVSSRILSKYVKKHQADRVITSSIMQYLAFLNNFGYAKCKFIGIIYMIYLHERKRQGIFGRLSNRLKYTIIARSQKIEKAFVLNDQGSADELNHIYNTKKFVCLPDPFVPLHVNNLEDTRYKYNIPVDNKIFLHFGGLSGSKGTLTIMEAIEHLSEDVAKQCTFIFAGKIYEDIYECFIQFYEQLKLKTQIIVENRFVEFSELSSFCNISHCMLVPYKRTSQSSGAVGYAAQFNIPVIGPGEGLLGNIIRSYQLGLDIYGINAENLSLAIQSFQPYKIDGSKYTSANNLGDFINTIYG